MKFILCLWLDIPRVKKGLALLLCVFKKTYFQLMKIINKDDSNDNNGSGSNNDNDVQDFSDNYGDSYSNHHEICDNKDDNDDD